MKQDERLDRLEDIIIELYEIVETRCCGDECAWQSFWDKPRKLIEELKEQKLSREGEE